MSNRLVVALCATLFLGSTASAQELTITGAHPNAGVLVIDGSGFHAGLYAGMAGRDLTVLSVNSHEVRAAPIVTMKRAVSNRCLRVRR